MTTDDCGYIKLYRKIFDWEWYEDINTFRLFTHMILKANWKDGNFKGTTVPRGSFVSSIDKLSDETGLTRREIRTAISHLETTGEVTVKTTNRYSIFTVKNFELYQNDDTQNDNQPTISRHSNDNLTTTIKEGKNIKNIMINNTFCSEPETTAPNLSGIKLVLNDKTLYDVPLAKIESWREAYPAVDIEQELQKMRVWLDGNPTKRKTRRGIERFIVNWLSRSQDSGGRPYSAAEGGDRCGTRKEDSRSFAL